MDAAWHPDPGGRHELRYWDGSAWTDHVSDNGVTGIDPLPPLPGAGGQAESHDHGQAQVDLSTEPTRFSPAGADPAPSYGGEPGQPEPAPAWQPWNAEQAPEPAAEPTPEPADVEPHEAETMPPTADEPPAEVSPFSRPSALDDPAHVTEPDPEPEPEPESEQPAGDGWIDGVLLPGERAVRTVSTTARDVTVTTQRVVVREESGTWTAIRLDRVSHAEVRETADGTVVGIFVTGGPSRSVTLTDATQAVALVNAVTS